MTHTGSALRPQKTLPGLPDISFTVVERNGFAVFIHSKRPIDIATAEKTLLATYTPGNLKLRSYNGNIPQNWLAPADSNAEAIFLDRGFIVVRMISERYDTGVIAALPVDHLNAKLLRWSLILLPVGLLAGVVLVMFLRQLFQRQASLPNLIRYALKHQEFILHYQPVVELNSGKWVGAEALLRWQRHNGEIISPDTFIPAAEESGMIDRVTERVLQLASQDLDQFLQLQKDFHLGINISAEDLHNPNTPSRVSQLLQQTQAQPHNLVLEATERGFMEADLALSIVEQIRELGVDIAIDDFGTGYSSLAYLETYEIDYLKIDKSFVDTLGTEAATSQVIFHIIQLSKGLGLTMVAEGVETLEQAQVLQSHGVQYAQGWYFGRPMPADMFLQQLQQYADSDGHSVNQ